MQDEDGEFPIPRKSRSVPDSSSIAEEGEDGEEEGKEEEGEEEGKKEEKKEEREEEEREGEEEVDGEEGEGEEGDDDDWVIPDIPDEGEEVYSYAKGIIHLDA